MSTITQQPRSTFGTISVPSRFNGPLESGNGGYSAGVIAGLMSGPTAVNLKSPVPLDASLGIERTIGRDVLVRHGQTLVAVAEPAPELDLTIPATVHPHEARRAAEHYHGSGYDLLSQCYVCGPDREDTFHVHAAPVEGRAVVATPWTPPAWAADADGNVFPEHVWAALDCPTYFGAYLAEPKGMAMLAQMQARIDAPIEAGVEHVVMAWPLATEGRKRWAASAVLSPSGEYLAVAKALIIELRR